MITKERESETAYFIGDPEHYVFNKDKGEEDLGEFSGGIYKTLQGDIYVVGEKERLCIVEFKRKELSKNDIKYLRLAGKVIIGGGELVVEGEDEKLKVKYEENGKESKEVFSGLKRVH